MNPEGRIFLMYGPAVKHARLGRLPHDTVGFWQPSRPHRGNYLDPGAIPRTRVSTL
jgi:hypothetical protein